MGTNSLPPILQSALARKLLPKIDYGIAFVGCGGIVNYGQIPAYKASGFQMVGGYDLNYEAPKKTAREHGLEKAYSSLDELLLDSAIQIVDIAVRGAQREPIKNCAEITEVRR